MSAPTLAVSWTGEQLRDFALIRRRRRIREERLQLVARGRQPDHIQVKPPQQQRRFLRRQRDQPQRLMLTGEDSINRMSRRVSLAKGRVDATRRLKRPVLRRPRRDFLIRRRCSLSDPALERLDFLRRQRRTLALRRHSLVVFARHPRQDQALCGVAQIQHRTAVAPGEDQLPSLQAQRGLLPHGPVTRVTLVSQQRLDL